MNNITRIIVNIRSLTLLGTLFKDRSDNNYYNDSFNFFELKYAKHSFSLSILSH